MNDNQTKLIEQLAQKLGTTSQYLWSILIKQAAIDATTTLVQTIIVCIAIYGLYRLHKKFSSPEKNGAIGNYYNEYELSIQIPMILAAIIATILLTFCFFSIGSIVNGYFHPEYWALHEILSTINSCK